MIQSTIARCILLAFASTVGFLVGVAVSLAFLPDSDVSAEVLNPRRELTLPDVAILPEEVVRLQVAALREFRHNDMALLQCYCLASPANRSVTGPLNRFAAMVRQPQFEALVLADHSLVGPPVMRGGQAAVLVTVVDANRRASVFRFVLSRQHGEPFDGCWMTDAVTPDMGAVPRRAPDSHTAEKSPSV